MDVRLHPAGPNNLAQILPLVTAYHAFEHLDNTPAQREAALRRLLENPEFGIVWLVYADEDLAGYIALCRGFSIEFNGFDAFIDEFFLLPEFRGEGIGKMVLDLVKNDAARFEINAIHLEVARDNHNARKLYRAAGFEAREKYLLMSVVLDA